jgi:uncharacterized protein
MSESQGPPDFTKRPAHPGDQPSLNAGTQQSPGYGPPPPQYGQPPHGSYPPPYGQPGQYGAPLGAPTAGLPLRADEEKTWGILAHAGGLILGFLSPLLVWLIFKDRSMWVDRTAKEALNFHISYTIYFFSAALSMLLLVGFLLLPVLLVMYYVFMILGIIKAANMQEYRFPLIVRFVN